MKIVVQALGILSILATILPFFKKSYWWIRIFDFPRAQITFFALASLILYSWFWDYNSWWENFLWLMLVGSAVYQIVKMFPYTFFAKKQTRTAKKHKKDSHFSLLVSNVYMYNKRFDDYVNDVVNQFKPDLILTLETGEEWEENLRRIEKDYPYTIKKPLNNTYGMLLYSKLELIDSKIKFIVEKEVPSFHTKVELKSGDKFSLHCLHPRPPRPTKLQDSTNRDAELSLVGEELRESSFPTVVAGDLNDVAWSRTTKLFQKVSGLLDPRIGRGMYSTFNAKNPLLRFPLDHVFHSDHFKLMRITRSKYFGSDHFSMFIQFSFEPNDKHNQETPDRSKEDVEQADEFIDRTEINDKNI